MPVVRQLWWMLAAVVVASVRGSAEWAARAMGWTVVSRHVSRTASGLGLSHWLTLCHL